MFIENDGERLFDGCREAFFALKRKYEIRKD